MKRTATTAGILAVIASVTWAGDAVTDNDYGQALFGAVSDADYYDDGRPNGAKVELGKALYWDKVLSGSRNISCATCHHALAASGDGLSLPVGEGGSGLGVTRDTGEGLDAIHERVPRNAPPIYNLGARAVTHMFHDGRVFKEPEQPSGFSSPAGDQLPPGLENVLAVQAMFPVTSGAEMAGQEGENAIADAAAAGNLGGKDGVWEQLADRLRDIPEYVRLFKAAYPGTKRREITYAQAANAIAAYEAVAFRADNSPFDRYLRGEWQAMSTAAESGMGLFYGKAGCADCHSGKFQTDMNFYAIAMPQIGPGKSDGLDGHDDFGREQVTKDSRDRYRFRTPPLRNVALTGPWGHDGAYDNLRAMVKHHLHPVRSLHAYDIEQAVLPSRADLDAIDFQVHKDRKSRAALAKANELQPVRLTETELDDMMAFLHALTDEGSLDLRDTVPMGGVPSGLPLFD